jgi:hypothetical protein
MDNNRLPKIASKFSFNGLPLKWDGINDINKSKFKNKMWCDKELEEKIKLRCYKDLIRRSQLSLCFDKCKEKKTLLR